MRATSPFPHSSRNQIACLQRKNQQHTHSMERRHRGRTCVNRGCKQPAAFMGWTTNPRRRSVRLSCEVCEAHRTSHSRPFSSCSLWMFSRSSLIHMISQPLEANHSSILVRNQDRPPPNYYNSRHLGIRSVSVSVMIF